MASPEIPVEEMDLRRRARRRLVGAIALALVAVVVLPMLFSPEPKPLGPEVDIRIPDQATPFKPREIPPLAAEPEPNEVEAPLARPEAPPVMPAPAASPAVSPPVAAPAPLPETAVSRPSPAPAEPKQPVNAKPVPVPKTDIPAAEAFAARGYYLQLGAFGNEANARQLAERARAAGFNVFVQQVGGQVRVRMGPYAERKQALEVQARLREKGFGPILLGP
ncbi:MAG: SPOR domain-containing protein [Thiobacillaceae bacterium]